MNTLKLFGLLLTVSVLGACSKDPKTYSSSRLETFTIDSEDVYTQANKILQADYMFVTDVSASMGYNSGNLSDPWASKREEFMSGLTNFVSTLDTQGIDFKFGFINGNVHAGRKNDLIGRSFYKNLIINSLMSPTQQDSAIDQLQDIGRTLNENTNLMLEAADTVMSSQKSTFVRDGSQLIYLFVSDTDDESPTYITGKSTSTTDYASRLISHKGTASNIPAFVSARAIVAGVNSNCTPANDFGESIGQRLAETAQIIENRGRQVASNGSPYTTATSSDVSHCILRASSEFPTLLSQLARDVSKPSNIFQLQVANVDIHSIKVYVNGTLLTNDKWEYLSGSNAVRIRTTPPATARVVLRYNQFFALKGTPSDVNLIQVKANGSIVLSDASNGWTYNATLNRIEINGTTLQNGSQIEVSY